MAPVEAVAERVRRYPDLGTLRAYRLGRLSLAAYLAATGQAATSPNPTTTRRETS